MKKTAVYSKIANYQLWGQFYLTKDRLIDECEGWWYVSLDCDDEYLLILKNKLRFCINVSNQPIAEVQFS